MPAPNMDTMNVVSLVEFSERHMYGREYKRVFPEGGGQAVKDTATLARYAACKASERVMKDMGHTDQAVVYRWMAGDYYEQLSPAGRWRKI